MDGIFGVGLAEVIMIGLVLFIIGGPENTAKWARQMGRWVRMGREALSDAMSQLEKEMGDDGKDIVNAAREVGNEFREVQRMASPRGWLESSVKAPEKPKAPLADDARPKLVKTPDADAALAAEPVAEQVADVDPQSTAQPASEAVDNAVDNNTNGSNKDKLYTAWMPPENT